jgi:hypothetical protein
MPMEARLSPIQKRPSGLPGPGGTTRGRIIYEPVLLAREGDDIFVEVHDDVYHRLPATARAQTRELALRLGVSDRIDWPAVDLEVDRRSGVARPVLLKPDPAH